MQGKRAVLKRTEEHDVAVAEKLSIERECTRCAGKQHLLAEAYGFGKYRCDTCELIIGFDMEAIPAEFIIHRGQPGLYSQDNYGAQLAQREQRFS